MLVETNIIYKYHAPGAPAGVYTTIAYQTRNLGPDQPMPHHLGETVTLLADDPEEFGEEPRGYRVVQQLPIPVQLGQPPAAQLVLFVIVTDPHA